MELEELEPSKLAGSHQDVETIAQWAQRNGVSFDTARGWVCRGVLPSVKLGKLRMVNTALLRRWLLEQGWTDER
ncbi:DNA-binding protein [Pseudomonas sp. PIC25]|uniref:DNA-binding protein n=1 Tax=Pseudomonas sp. PIC25 TaxID=1958773 RepID=UPI000BAB3E02|nr:DNA-binding protein [Pseudomonas sp. PIC25]PAU60576.1 DNA-binding protein [Pseudomonas sp. PIC25]